MSEAELVDLRSVRPLVERALAEDPDGGVVIVADKRSETGSVVKIMALAEAME